MPAPISETDLVAALESLAADLGRPPTRAEMEAEGPYSATPYYHQFGSWPAALERAGLDPQSRQEIPETELLAEIRDLAADLGYVPRPQDMASQGRFSPSTYRRRFGSWATALDQADLSQDQQPPAPRIARADLITALYQLTHDLGRPPTQNEMDSHGPYSSDVYHDRFGSWSEALTVAGLKLDDTVTANSELRDGAGAK